MNLSINSVVYFYIFICVALLVFNILYILRTEGRTRKEQRRIRAWEALLEREIASDGPDRRFLDGARRRLRRVSELTAFNAALEEQADCPARQAFVDGCYDIFPGLALHYQRRPSMERAFFAYVIARYPSEKGGERLPALLLEFLDNSTVYCRENVLQALYALGSAGGVEQALRLFSERGWYHHSHMLADGLTGFRGDREELAVRLWQESRDWDENMRSAVVQFAANVTDRLQEPFRQTLADPDAPLEVRFAIIRYFTRRVMPEVKPLLLEMVRREMHSGETAIVASSALARYPGDDTLAVLEAALLSRNWYVRHNAAVSLLALGDETSAYEAAERVGDRYAREMLDYVTGKNVRREEVVAS